MTTRLDRLLLLLDTGSTPSIRLTAARQLGQIAAQTIQHSSISSLSSNSNQNTSISNLSLYQSEWRGIDGEWKEIINLLGRILPYLRSKSWETRQAAGEAVDGITKTIGIWDPTLSETQEDDQINSSHDIKPTTSHQSSPQRGGLLFKNFDFDSVLREGTILLSSAGKEFDYRSIHHRSNESLNAAKRDVASKLGLGIGSFGFDLDSVGMDVNKELEDSAQSTSNFQSDPQNQLHPIPMNLDQPSILIRSSKCDTPLSQSATLPLTGSGGSSHVNVPAHSAYSTHVHVDDDPTHSVKSTPTMPPLSLPPRAPIPEADLDGLSARERNALKRKRKAANKAASLPAPISSAHPGIDISNSTHNPLAESAPTPSKFRILEQASSTSNSSGNRVAVPVSSSLGHPIPSQTNLLTDQEHTSDLSPTTPTSKSNPFIIDPGAKAQARKSLTADTGSPNGETACSGTSHPNNNSLLYAEGQWPFTSFVEILMIDLFSSQWEFRHGAALGLIPIIKNQGFGAGKSIGASRFQNLEQHLKWMEDLGLRLVCLLSLDRFGDYVGDQVVAPVREIGAQGISLVGRWLDQNGLHQLLRTLHQMVEQKNASSNGQRSYAWQVRHAGLMAMKYLVAVKSEMLRADVEKAEVFSDTVDIQSVVSTDVKTHISSKVEFEINHSAKPDLSSNIKPNNHNSTQSEPSIKLESDIRTSMEPNISLQTEVNRHDFVKPEVSVKLEPDIHDLNKSNLSHKPEHDTYNSNQQFLHDHQASASVSGNLLEHPINLLSVIVTSALIGLKDDDDDVRAAASGALLPVTELLVKYLPSRLNELLQVLWDALGNAKDDLSSSVGNIMDLLANLIAYPVVLTRLSRSLGGHTLPQLIPRLFPFFRHTISTVRLSVVKAISVFLHMPDLSVRSWVDESVLRLTFQNLLVEIRADIRAISHEVWNAAISGLLDESQSHEPLTSIIQPHISGWLELVSTPRTQKLNASLFFMATRTSKSTTLQDPGLTYNVDKFIMSQDLTLVSLAEIIRGRLAASKALGYLMAKLTHFNQLELFTSHLASLIDSTFAMPKMIAAVVIKDWAQEYRQLSSVDQLTTNLGQIIAIQPLSQKLRTSPLFSGPSTMYSELEHLLITIRKDIEGLLASFVSLGKVPPEKIPKLPISSFGIEHAAQIINHDYHSLIPLVARGNKKAAMASLEDRQQKLAALVIMFERDKVVFDTRLDAAVATAVVALREIPGKISPLIKGLTQSIKNETLIDLQTYSANALASFIDICVSPNSPVKNDPTDKIIGNLATYLCQDESQTPTFAKEKSNKRGILSAQDGGISLLSKTNHFDGESNSDQANEDAAFQAKLLRRGAELTLSALASRFGENLIDRIPKLWHCMSEPLVTLFQTDDVQNADSKIGNQVAEPKLAQDLLDCLTVLPAVASSLPISSHSRLVTLFGPLCHAIKSKFAVVRYSVVRCFAELCNFLPEQGLLEFITHVLPLVGDPLNLAHRQGAIEMLSKLVDVLDTKILAYIIFLVVPVLGRMSDPDDDVRHVATNTFACLIKLMPLEAGVPDPPGFSREMLEKRQSERQFLSQLLGSSKIEEYNIPIKIKADLRKYQRDGISWLAFLAKYQLHGILCDDMGLGKTLQSICILASKHHERAESHRINQSPDTVHLPSLVVCPPTLTGHWAHEILTYTTKLKPLLYVGGPQERAALVRKIRKYDVIILSYDIVRNDIERLSKISWNYCILDEGHIIKNAKSKLCKAVKLLKANHRLILSGTPIQNNALELWSLFDFLMPGFLGTEKYFNERFGRPINASRDAKSSSKEQEAGALALEALHKQVLPFLLRRLKEDVLEDLPPKIIQDYYCELSPIQKQLYEDFAKSQAKTEVEGVVKKSTQNHSEGHSSQHVFQALQYLKKLVNHPALVLRPEVPRHQAILSKLGPKGLRDLTHAPKLLALRQILRDCGIGLTTSTHLSDANAEEVVSSSTSGATVPQHRVLIFCQMKQMLDIVENDLFKQQMPYVTYMRMDGSTDASKRHGVVQRFNSDPSIDCLLLTTHVGGLGLNLTSADTVIFVEHDWNPMRDLQAMDRAHRLGQKKVVNVYRLITRATLEEKIMGLQRFKLNIATSIVNQQNSNLGSLDTEQILDLFNLSAANDATSAKQGTGSDSSAVNGSSKTGMKKNVLDGLEDLPPESEYESLDPAKFLSSL
ncbi:hypothetical protein O181_027941 [Austropuccinia psidii MF-1]|uniref:TATA-binding protein-associated factor mot1 n=1 Tax=Austropuccinia psidii MF-1 TaxID=1389203 RepID=A0A9Q3CTG9_9BASI|nr:hypothetical protein [Austropuccinia psidii MF-1]